LSQLFLSKLSFLCTITSEQTNNNSSKTLIIIIIIQHRIWFARELSHRTRNHLSPLLQPQLHRLRIITFSKIPHRQITETHIKIYEIIKKGVSDIPWSTIVVLELLTSPSDATDEREEVLDNPLLYCLLTAQYNPRAGRVSDSLGSSSGESGSNPNPSSMHPFSSSRSSSVTLLLRPSRPDGLLPFFLSQASSRSASGDHECCFISGLGGGCDRDALRFDILKRLGFFVFVF
ncbi:unnamed protein product, partial [Brassica rapa]